MKYIKVFESIDIDKEEIKLWMVDLLDEDFEIIINNPYEYAGEIVDGICIKIVRREQYIINEIVESLYFVTDMIKRKYNLDLSHISLLAGDPNRYIYSIESVYKFDNILDSTITSDNTIGIYYKPPAKGINKYVQKFIDFDPVNKLANLPVNMIMKGAEKLNKYLKK